MDNSACETRININPKEIQENTHGSNINNTRSLNGNNTSSNNNSLDIKKTSTTKLSNESQEFRELNKEIFSIIQQGGNLSGISVNNNTNGSIGGTVNINDNTWGKKSHNNNNISSTSNKGKHTLVPNPRKQQLSENLVSKEEINKDNTSIDDMGKNDNKNNDENISPEDMTDDIPNTIEKINPLHIQECKTNNLSEIDSFQYTFNKSNNFIPKANFNIGLINNTNKNNNLVHTSGNINGDTIQQFPNSNMHPQQHPMNPLMYHPLYGGVNYYFNPYLFTENAFTYSPENINIINNQNYNNNNNTNNNQNNGTKRKKKFKDKFDQTLFTINLEQLILGTDIRTTVMIRHIPNKYSSENLLEEIDFACKGKYDFFYLPIDTENNLNLGYSFINFVDPLHIIYFYHLFKARKWNLFKSHKECDLSFAKFQGKIELTAHLEKNNNKIDDNKKLPMLFTVTNAPQVEMPKEYYEYIKRVREDLLQTVVFK